MSQVVNHLLFHKAMVGVDIDRVDQYIEIADGASSAAEVSTIEDPFTRSVTLLFMLVKEHGLDPWSLDMKHLIMEYQKYALKDDDLDLPLAGSVLGWAWDVLKMRASGAIDATEPIPEPQPDWVDFDFGWEPTYAEQLEDSVEPPIEESVLFRGERRVTLMELVGALEDARNVENERKARLERRRQLKEARESVLSEVAEKLVEYVQKEVKKGTRVNQIMSHTVGLYHGQNGANKWKRYLSDNMMARDSDFQKAKHIMDIAQNNEKANQLTA